VADEVRGGGEARGRAAGRRRKKTRGRSGVPQQVPTEFRVWGLGIGVKGLRPMV